jgi:hypothetical protein
MKNFILFLILFPFLVSCSNGFENASIGNTYQFICNGINSNCNECDSYWFVKINSENSGTIYSSTSPKSFLRSCSTDFSYTFDTKTGSIIINNLSNPNVNSSCLNGFIGTWTFNRSGVNGRGFYKNDNCGFVR